jgi:hypothetical protein
MILPNGQISSDGTCDSCFIQFHRGTSVATVYTSEYRAEPFHGWGDCVFWHCFPCRQDSTNPARISLQCRRPRGFLLVAVNIAGSHIYIYITYKNFQKAEAILMMSPRTIKSKHYVLRKWSFLMRSSPSTYINHHFSRISRAKPVWPVLFL